MRRQPKSRFRLLGFWCALTAGPLVAAEAEVSFQNEIEPILRRHCAECHGPDEQESGFRLDRLASMLSGGESGEPAIVPGDPMSSYLIKLIRQEVPGKEMPPEDPLAEDQIRLIEEWIAAGAKTPERYGPVKAEADLSHWAFKPIDRVDARGLDDFIRRKMNDKDLRL